MSKFAPVVPLSVATVLQSMNLLGAYHLLLAHDVVIGSTNKKDLYAKQYRNLRDPVDGTRTIIMDNSVVELGTAADYEIVRSAADVVAADYMVAADYFGDLKGTMERSLQFAQRHKAAQAEGLWTTKLVGVVQGQTLHECMQCASFYAGNEAFDGIAIPRCLTPILGSRMTLCVDIYTEFGNRFDLYHLLGFSDDIFDDLATAKLPFIDGIDSAAPIRGAINGLRLVLPGTNFGPRGDFWDTDTHTAYVAHRDLEFNLNTIRQFIA